MSEYRDSRDVFAEELLGEMPPVPSEAVLTRVRSEANARDGRHRLRPPSWRWQVGITLAATVGVLALAWGVLAPRVETMAFAKERAVAAMKPPSDGRIWHAVVRVTETGWTEQFGHQPELDRNDTWEEWFDPKNERDRWEIRNSKGVLEEVTLRVGNRDLWAAGINRNKPELIETKPAGPIGGSLAQTAGEARKMISDGDAKVMGTDVIDAHECWVIRAEYPPDAKVPSGKDVFTIKLRKPDYRPMTWERYSTYKNGNGNCWDRVTMTYLTMESVEPSSVPSSKFSFDELIKLAPPGTKIEYRDSPQ